MKYVDPGNLTGTYTLYSPVFPNPFICVREMVGQLSYEILNRSPSNGIGPWLRENWEWHYTSFYFEMAQVYHIFGIAVLLTLFRIFLNFALLKRIPKWFNIVEHDAEKFPESAWKSIIYAITWTWAVYLCIFSEDKYFFYPVNTWRTFVTGVPVPSELYWLYMLQMGFYVHCVYASIFLETIRRDFTVLMLHHFLTLGLLSYSFGVRYHYIGLLLLFIQDIGDVSLEVTKSILYFKTRNGKDHKGPEILANIGFAFFTLQWIVFRLYWYITKVVYTSSYVSMLIYPNGPFYLSFNIMLLALYAMQVYWFIFIVKLLVKVLSGEDVKDNRETEEEEAARQLAVEKEKVAKGLKTEIVFRLYWYITKVVYSSSYVSMRMYPNGPFYLPFNIMLLALYAMQVYWFIFIVKLLVKVFSGEDVKDNRETDEEEAARQLAVEKEKVAKGLKTE